MTTRSRNALIVNLAREIRVRYRPGRLSQGSASALVEPEVLDSAFWHAARNGLSADLVDPHTQRLCRAPDVVHALLREASAGLAEHEDAELVGSAVDRILRIGNGATQQRRAMERGGMAALAELIDTAAPNRATL